MTSSRKFHFGIFVIIMSALESRN